MPKQIIIHNPRTGKKHPVNPAAMRRCERCDGVMFLYKYWWDAEKSVRITYRCDCQQSTKLKTVTANMTRTGELK